MYTSRASLYGDTSVVLTPARGRSHTLANGSTSPQLSEQLQRLVTTVETSFACDNEITNRLR